MNIGGKIKAARLAKDMTQEELGRLLGVQKSAVAKYESGKIVNIKRSTLKKISDILNIRPSELIFDESPAKAAELHARIVTDFELMEALKDYYKLDDANKKIVRDLIKNLQKKEA